MHLKTTPTACGNLAASEANFSDVRCLKQAFTCTAAYFRLSPPLLLLRITNDDLFQVYTATGEQKLKEVATIAVHIEPVCFSLKVNLLDKSLKSHFK